MSKEVEPGDEVIIEDIKSRWYGEVGIVKAVGQVGATVHFHSGGDGVFRKAWLSK